MRKKFYNKIEKLKIIYFIIKHSQKTNVLKTNLNKNFMLNFLFGFNYSIQQVIISSNLNIKLIKNINYFLYVTTIIKYQNI